MTIPDLGYNVGRCILGQRAARRRQEPARLAFWTRQLAFARARLA